MNKESFMNKYLWSVLLLSSASALANTIPTTHILTETPRAQVNRDSNMLDLKKLATPNARLVLKNPNTGKMEYIADWWEVLKKDGYFYELGSRLQGYALHADQDEAACQLVDIKAAPDKLEGQPTTAVSYSMNLDSNLLVPTKPFEPKDKTTFNYSATGPHYDMKGKPHEYTIYFVKTASNHFSAYIYVDGGYVARGALEFDTTGKLSMASGLDHIPRSAEESQNYFSINVEGTTQTNNPNKVYFVDEDGYPEGSLIKETVDKHGCLTAYYSNNVVKSEYKVAIVHAS